MVRFGVRVSIFVGFVVFLTLVVYFGTRQPKPKPVQEIVTKARFQGNARKPIPGNIGKEKKEAAAQAEMGKDNGMAGLAAFFGNLKVETEKDVLAKTQKAAEVERVKNENFVVEAQAADEKEEEIASGSDKDGFKVSKKKKTISYLSHPLVARLLTELGDNTLKSTPRPPTIEDDEARFPITLCALIPDEQRFLPEWLLYHRLMGVERFILYDTVAPGSAGAGEIEDLQDTKDRDTFVKGILEGAIPVPGNLKDDIKKLPLVDDKIPVVVEKPIVAGGKRVGGKRPKVEEVSEDEEFEGIAKLEVVNAQVVDPVDKKAAAEMRDAIFGKNRVKGSRQKRAPVDIPFTGLDKDGKILAARIAGIERWILDGTVIVKFLQQKDPEKIQPFHHLMTQHCTKAFSSTTNYLAHLDIDEFLIASTSLYGPQSPYQDKPPPLKDFLKIPPPSKVWHYPLHDLLQRPILQDAACVAIPQLKFRNVGIRYLLPIRGVLATHVIRDVVEHQRLSEKTILHTAYGSGFVSFDGPHSCKTQTQGSTPNGVTRAIKNSQGTVLQSSGTYLSSADLPIEPLAIAHYGQRDLQQCLIRLSKSPDSKVICQEAYLPSQAELDSLEFTKAAANQILLKVPTDGSVIYDERVKNSWSAEATRAVLAVWNQQPGATPEQIEAARDKVAILLK